MLQELDRKLLLSSPQLIAQKDYWLEKLSEFVDRDPHYGSVLSAAGSDVFRDSELSGDRGRLDITLPKSLSHRLMELGKGMDISVYIILVTALKILIRRRFGIINVPVVSPLYKQNVSAETMNHCLYIYDRIEPHRTFRELVLQVRQSVLEAYENQDYPLEEISEILGIPVSARRSAQSQVGGTGEDIVACYPRLHDIERMGDDGKKLFFQFDRVEGEISATLHYSCSLYDSSGVEKMAAHFSRILTAACGDIHAVASGISSLPDAEMYELLHAFNDTDRAYPKGVTVPGLFNGCAHDFPGVVALKYRDSQLTFRELNGRASILKADLDRRGVGGGSIVAVLLNPGLEMVIAILAVLKSNGAYLPIDHSYPDDRKLYILRDSGAGIIITSRELSPGCDKGPACIVQVEACLHGDAVAAAHAADMDSFPPSGGLPAYAIYTSGSSGRPKGILVEHESFTDFVDWAVKEFGHCPGYQVLLSNSYASDGSIQQIFPPLVTGGTLHIIHPDIRADVEMYAAYLLKNRINNIDEVPALMNVLFRTLDLREDEELLPHLTCISLGSDHVPIEVVRKCRKYLNHRGEIINAYGPAETSVETCSYRFDGRKADEVSLIGRPRQNIRVYIFSRDLECLPVGSAGEICIGGLGVARGYINRPELTARRFIENSVNGPAPGNIYRSGDLGRCLPDGNIEFLGRMDHQVNIRGYRVELAEVENRLLERADVSDAVVVARSRGTDDRYLCAYVIPRRELTAAELRKDLEGKLPAFMVPSYFVLMEKFPLTPNSKVDRNALPEPQMESAELYVPPDGGLEETLVRLFSEILDIGEKKVGATANFFDLGGHSLRATVLLAKIHKELDVRIPLTQIFEDATVRGMASFIKASRPNPFVAIEPVEKREFYELSSAQKRLYILQQIDFDSTAYNLPVFVELAGDLEQSNLERTFEALIYRHESFRTSFEMSGTRPVQRIYDRLTRTGGEAFRIDYHPFTSSPSDDPATVDFAPERLIRSFVRPFDLSEAPLLRVGLVRLRPDGSRHLLMVDLHHIISDGVSDDIFIKDFMVLYEKGPEALPPLKIQYRDFAEWQKRLLESGEIVRQECYWLGEFTDEPQVLNLPVDFPRPSVQSFEGDSLNFRITKEDTLALKFLARSLDLTLYMLLLSIFKIFLSRICGQEDIVVGTPVATRRHADLDQIIGMFVNVLGVRSFPAGDKKLTHYLREVKEKAVKAFENQDYQFEDLVEQVVHRRDTSRNPLFDVMFALQNMEARTVEIPGLKLKLLEFEGGTVQFDLILEGEESADELYFTFAYSTRLFKKATAEQFIAFFMAVVKSVIENSNRELRQIEIITPERKQRILSEFNEAGNGYSFRKGLSERFRDRVSRSSDAVGLVDRNQQVTYGELDRLVDRLAALLRKLGVQPGTIVGLMVETGLRVAVGILGILRSGAAYLPIDHQLNEKRILFMLADCRASVLVCQERIIEKYSFTTLQGIRQRSIEVRKTPSREPIRHLDRLPIPDRSLVDYEKYSRYIGHAMVKNALSLQATRGCPYRCAFCEKIWPKKHVARSAEHIFSEIKFHYDLGIRRFSFVDDIFNFDIKNSRRFFELVIKNRLDIQLYLTGGLRGDLLSRDYIDLMIKAGTVNVALALETASPRLQKLIGKNLDVDRLRENLAYLCERYPGVITELFIMHGFPGETEKEALETLDFLMDLRWVHFPYISILHVYPNTEMEKLALEAGVYREAIARSENLAYHQLPYTLQFDKDFTLGYQARFLNEYFLRPERLLHVLPFQMRIMTEDEMVQKYNSYLPTDIKSIEDLIEFSDLKEADWPPCGGPIQDYSAVKGMNRKMEHAFAAPTPGPGALRVLLLDLSQSFSADGRRLYDVVEPPLGLMYLLTYLNNRLGDRVTGRIARSRIDFDRYEELKSLVEQFDPQVIGIRTLTMYRDFFHKTVMRLRQWLPAVPIIAGGPYTMNNYDTLLQDPNVDLAVLGEGEETFCELIGKMIENNGRLPDDAALEQIHGLAVVPSAERKAGKGARQIVSMDDSTLFPDGPFRTGSVIGGSDRLAYVIYTSGSTGTPKGVLVEERSVVNVLDWFGKNYKLAEGVHVLLMSHYSFDASVEDILATLLYGATLYAPPRETILEKAEIRRYIETRHINLVDFVPSMLKVLLGDDPPLPGIDTVISGGEVLEEGVKNRLLAKGYQLFNHYGPTETTVDALAGRCSDDEVSLGTPIANTGVCVLDKYGNPLPPGIVGELYIRGAGTARGYLNNPRATADHFVGCPSVAYRTGDLVRSSAAGTIQYVGRKDNQLKIRGYRVEPEEIEKHILDQADVTEAAVVPAGTGNGAEDLYAYVAADPGIDMAELRKKLEEALPGYMVPARFFRLESIPLGPNGKIDRRALPLFSLHSGDYPGDQELCTPPRDELERRLAHIWKQVLELEADEIGIDDDFFDLGGHSLKSTILLSRIHRDLQVKIPLGEIYKDATIRGLAEYIRGIGGAEVCTAASKEVYTAIPEVEERDYYELSSAQKRVYFLQQLDPAGTGFNVSVMLTIEGDLDRECLSESFNKLLRRHESFRTSFVLVEDEPVQRIHRRVDVIPDFFDLSGGGECLEDLFRDFVQPFNLSLAPLLRIGLVRRGDRKFWLMTDMHHIITDGLSHDIFVRNLISFYGKRELRPLRLQYKDFCRWQNNLLRSGVIHRQEKYWLERFENGVPVLNLPLDYPRPPLRDFRGDAAGFELSAGDTRALKEMASSHGVTLYMVLLGIFNIFLSRVCGQEDIVVGTPIAGRRHADLEPVIGMFVNTLVMRNEVRPDMTFADFLGEVKRCSVEAFENQDYQFEHLVERISGDRDAGRNPLFDVLFSFQGSGEFSGRDLVEELPGLAIKPFDTDEKTVQVDIVLEGGETGKILYFIFEYRTSLFKKEKIRRFVDYFKTIVSQIVTGGELKLKDIQISFDFKDIPDNAFREESDHFVF